MVGTLFLSYHVKNGGLFGLKYFLTFSNLQLALVTYSCTTPQIIQLQVLQLPVFFKRLNNPAPLLWYYSSIQSYTVQVHTLYLELRSSPSDSNRGYGYQDSAAADVGERATCHKWRICNICALKI